MDLMDIKVVKKENSALMRLIDKLVKPFCPRFMTDYTTTIGSTVYMPGHLPDDIRDEILRHELVHVEQYHKWGVLFYATYLLLPLPAFFTFRGLIWELDAYTESMQVDFENYGEVPEESLELYVREFSGPAYLWMIWPPSIARKLLLKRKQLVESGGWTPRK